MKTILLTPFIIMVLFLTGCNQKCMEITQRFDDGSIKTEKYFPNCKDKTVYMIKNYFQNGQIESKGNFVNGSKNGEFKRWNIEDVLIEHWFMKNDQPIGKTICRYDNGELKKIIKYDQKSDFSDVEEWSEDSENYMFGKYLNGKRSGRWIMSNRSNSFIHTFRNDSLNGYTYEYILDSNKITHITGEYINDKENGIWKWYDKDSILFQIAEYDKGKLVKFLPFDISEKLKM